MVRGSWFMVHGALAMGYWQWAIGHGPWSVEDLGGAVDETTWLGGQLLAAETQLAKQIVLAIRRCLVGLLWGESPYG
jgi:hypothetical protein